MGFLWGRQAVLTFGVKGEQGVRATGLRISFDVTKETEKNNAKITVYNLNEANRGILKNSSKLAVRLDVGYIQDRVDMLWTGDITRAASWKENGDWITEIISGDGDQAKTEGFIDKSYAAGTDLKSVIKDVVQSLKNAGGLAIGDMSKIVTDIAQNGFAASGAAKNVMDALMARQGKDWSIQDGEIVILDKNAATTEEAVVLTPNTGLIGSPIIREKGVEVKALIQTTRLRPGRALKLESALFKGTYRIAKSHYIGDTHSQDWYVTCEATEIK